MNAGRVQAENVTSGNLRKIGRNLLAHAYLNRRFSSFAGDIPILTGSGHELAQQLKRLIPVPLSNFPATDSHRWRTAAI